MARTIGKKNITLVKKITRKEIEKAKMPYFIRSDSQPSIEDKVIEKLPASLWDIWESADSEIRRIIWDTNFEDSDVSCTAS